MLPESSPGTTHTVKMLAILEQWNVESGCYMDNTARYLLMMLFKLGLDAAVHFLCCRKLYSSILSMCSLSIVLADSVVAFSLATMCFLGAEASPMSPCSLLAHASATYGAVPLPMMFLGLLDYCLEDTHFCKQRAFCRCLRNAVLILLIWLVAVAFSFCSVNTEPMELEYSTHVTALVCEVEESPLISCFTLLLFTAVICAMLPFWSSILKWQEEADRLSEAREEQENPKSDFLFVSTNCATEAESSQETHLEEINRPRPPLWLSLTLGFAMFWMPYLFISVLCLVLGFGVPAYITVNVLWMECTNSLLMGVVFWAKSSTLGPYDHLPENVCLWHVYWHLSKGTGQRQLPVAVFNPSKVKRTTLFYV
ncbi:probable G-protein coupled receptor 160 [Acanthopagrus latus]|uniref:probable G-protein coupled receptor 160 n=1 Tax=Acanthopagrus latus TaxID=8177 RepID=UPI00187BDB5F|nr:probable G-protein coupled receptor 160 [Acanthopagrus latus]